jgi:PAN domain
MALTADTKPTRQRAVLLFALSLLIAAHSARAGENTSAERIEPGMEVNVERIGSDYDLFDVDTLAECQRNCLLESRCKAWTYVRPGKSAYYLSRRRNEVSSRATCLLKDAVRSPSASDCCISGVVPNKGRSGVVERPGESGVFPPAPQPSTPSLPPVQPAGPQPHAPQGASAARCLPGFVWREARPTDHVCVPPESRALIRQENGVAPTRWDPNGPYGPYTCIAGYVWREAFDGDVVCVSPERRAQVKEENRLAPTRREWAPRRTY